MMDEIINALDTLYSLLGEEVEWSVENFDIDELKDLSDQYKLGFIAGVKQAQNLLIDFEIRLVTYKKEKYG